MAVLKNDIFIYAFLSVSISYKNCETNTDIC